MPNKGDKAGGWTLEKRLGEGENGIVWQATNDKGESCAIKFLRADKKRAIASSVFEMRSLCNVD